MQKKNYEIVSFYKFCPVRSVQDYRILFKKNLIKFVPTNPAPPVIKIFLFFNVINLD